MDYDSYDSASEIAQSEVSGDSGDYGYDGGSDEQPRARQVNMKSAQLLAISSSLRHKSQSESAV